MTLTNIRLRELQRIAEDRATACTDYFERKAYQDTAAALSELIDFREKLAAMVRSREP